MRPPEFWSGQARGRDAAPMLQALLTPVSWAYAAVVSQRVRAAPRASASAPVISIGNLTLGGAGKTPVTRALRAKLGEGAVVLLRGYGGRSAGARIVSPGDNAREVGDEALLHARDGPTIVCPDRAAAAAAAPEARVFLLDDAHQNTTLAKDLSLLVVDAQAMFGNGKVFPAGPLREPLAGGIARADAIVLLSSGADASANTAPSFDRPVLRAHLAPLSAPPAGPLVAFAGIARPQKFFDTLTAAGANLVEAAPYPDHHPFTESELDWLAKLAAERDARLITTEKDHVRLPPAWRDRVAVLPVAARFEDEAALDAVLAPVRARLGAG